MKHDNLQDTMTSLNKALIQYDYKQVIDTSGDVIVTLSNDYLTTIIKVDKVANKITLNAYNRVHNKHHKEKVLFVTRKTRDVAVVYIFEHV